MSRVFIIIGYFFGWLLKLCCELTSSFGWAVCLFTILSKVMLLPLAIMVQFNSIKMVKMYPEMNMLKIKYFGDKDMISEAQYKLYKEKKYHPILDIVPILIQLILLMGVVEGIKSLLREGFNMMWLGLDLSLVPISVKGFSVLIPVLAAMSALAMCVTQNISNVLQSEQSGLNKCLTLIISVGLSLYLGLFVPAGIGLYWIAGNILSIIQMYLLNFFINPQKYIDYDALEKSKQKLNELESLYKKQMLVRNKDEKKRENIDYKRFMRYGTKQIVFYSEKNGFYKYYKDVIEYILKKTDIDIHYISSDINDTALQLDFSKFHTYYIGENKLIVLMMKLDTDIMVMTTPDLQKYHIKRSLVRNDIEYIYMDHGINSLNMVLRKHAIDAFDTIFAANELIKKEIREQEKLYCLKEKKIIEYGYCLIDNMITNYTPNKNAIPTILIGPSWQDDNIMDSCIETILDAVLGKGYKIVLRPHPQYIKHSFDKIEILRGKYGDCTDFEIQTDFSSNSSVYNADILMTDWSGIAYEYSFTTLKPTLFINTPMKVMNPDYEEINVVPFDIEIRNKIGISIGLDELNKLNEIINMLLNDSNYDSSNIELMRNMYLYNVGCSAEIGAKYIIDSLIEKSKQ